MPHPPVSAAMEEAASAESHFRLLFFAVVSRILAQLEHGAAAGDEAASWLEAFPFLAGYRQALARHEPAELPPDMAWAWWDEQARQATAPPTMHLPLLALATAPGLQAGDLRLLLAAGLVEEDIRFGALFAALQNPLAARRPCVGLLGWLLDSPVPGAASFDAWGACQRLLAAGLLVAENQPEPRSEWLLRVPAPIWDALQGRPPGHLAAHLSWQSRHTFPALADLILPPELQARIAHLPELVQGDRLRAVVLRGMGGTGRRTLAGSVARELGRDVLLWQGDRPEDEGWRLLGPLATVMGSFPILRCDPGPGESLELPNLAGYQGPVGITLGRSGGLRGPLVERSISLALPPPDLPGRRRFWQATGVAISAAALDAVAHRFLLTGGHIHRAAGLAEAHAWLSGRTEVDLGDVHQASQALNRQVLETLAIHLEPAGGWADLVVSDALARELQALEARCRSRESLRERAGPAFGSTLNRGVRAMLSGASGTGKTLAARALAAALQMDIYRVDLAAVVNKYIGETERNLNLVLSRAEELDVVLLLDEGDALMARRTDVRNSNDRYANLETNYLLQRLESYEGIVLITTNAGQRIDEAFLRRLDVIIDFPAPDAAERWLIWQAHLPRGHAVSPAFLDDVANRCALTGGQIRNAALQATLLAGDRGLVDESHVELALQREYRKAGAAFPMRAIAPNGSQLSRVRQFAADLQ